MDTKRALRALCAVALVGGSLALAACGSDSDDNNSSSSSSGSGSASADVAAAKATLAPYTGKPSPFPVEKPLTKKPGADASFDYLQCVTPICGLFATILPPATKTLGVKLATTKAGASADQLQAAMDTIIANNPEAVILPAVEPDTINTKLKELSDKKIPIISNGIMNHEKYGINAAMFNTETASLAGQILASWVVKNKGDKANVVFYTTPELSFGPVMEKSFTDEMKKLCPDCKVRQVDVPVATIGNSAPARVVSDLQANPDTNIAVFSTQEAAVGLASAMKTAGLSDKVVVTGFGPNPAVLADIKAGNLASGLGLDLAVMLWTQVDAAARLATGQPVTPLEEKGIPPMQMLEPADLKGVPVDKGWSGYPDFPARFAKLWGGAQAQ